MNNSLNIITELIERIKRFENEKGQEPKDVKEFIIWLKQFKLCVSGQESSPHSLTIPYGPPLDNPHLGFYERTKPNASTNNVHLKTTITIHR